MQAHKELNKATEDWCLYKQTNEVNFKMLKLTVIAISSNLEITKEANDNLQLFFTLLSAKPTFAKKSYEELNKLKNL